MNLQLSSQLPSQNSSRLTRRLAVNFGISAALAVLALAAAVPAWAQTATTTQLSSSMESGSGVAKTLLTANVSDLKGKALSEGSVSFETAKGSLGSAFVSNGVATLAVSALPKGVGSVTAVYHGDSVYGSSSASTQVTTAASGLPTFAVTGSPTSLSLSPGDFGTVLVTVTSQNDFSQAVNLSCSGLPQQAQCIFNTTPVTPAANGSVTSTLQITTVATTGAVRDLPGFGKGASGIAYAILIPGLLALGGLGAMRRRSGSFRVLGVVILLVAGVFGTSGCAARYYYNHRPPAANGGTPVGTYTVVVSAYSSNGTSVQNATPLNLTLTIK